jgi:membrane dipeptidase
VAEKKWLLLLRRAGLVLAALAAVFLALLFLWVPGFLDARLNGIHAAAPPVSPETEGFHAGLTVVDLHADTLLWKRDPLARNTRGHADVPRLIEGNVALQVFSAVTALPPTWHMTGNRRGPDGLIPLTIVQGWPAKTWFSPRERALYIAGRFDRAARLSNGRLRLIRYREELARYLNERRENRDITAGLLSIEGLHCLAGDRENVRVMYNAGFRIMGLVHYFDNRLGGSKHGTGQGGLTPFGEEILRFMELLKIIPDLAHASPLLLEDVLARAERPVLVSHTGCRALHDSPRTMSDEQMQRVAVKGGLIGIGFWEGAAGGQDIGAIVRSLRHAVNVAGMDHVALGSDFDGCTWTPFDAAGLAALTAALREAGFTPEEIEAVAGGNAVRFFSKWLPSEADSAHPDRSE